MAKSDIEGTKDESKRMIKDVWCSNWKSNVENILKSDENEAPISLYNKEELIEAVKSENSNSINHTWYHMIILEAVAFEAYTPLGMSDKEDKAYRKIKYSKQLDFLKEMVSQVGIGTVEMVDRYEKTYNKALDTATGKIQNRIASGLIVLAISAIIAATAGAAAGPIAVSLLSSQFVGLSGAALVSACLAALGGGAIAVGGTGVAGGVLVIVGGGALLGAAGAGAIVAGAAVMAKDNPELVISQGAKLTVVLREIILNGQRDVKAAQAVLGNFKNQIIDMQKEMAEIRLGREDDKKTIQNLSRAIEALERLYRNADVFASSFETGLQIDYE